MVFTLCHLLFLLLSPPFFHPPTLMQSFVQIQVLDLSSKLAIWLFLCLCHPGAHVHFTSFYTLLLISEASSIQLCLHPLLSHPSPLFEVIRGTVRAHATVLSFHPHRGKKRERKRKVFRPWWSIVISPPVWNDSFTVWLIVLLGTRSKQTTSGCGVFHPNWL